MHTPSQPVGGTEELSTIQQARDLAAQINADPNPIGGGVPKENDENDYVNDVSGIYLEQWNNAVDPRPGNGFNQWYLLRFNSGYGGTSVGLIRSGAKRKGGGLPEALAELRTRADDWAKANPKP